LKKLLSFQRAINIWFFFLHWWLSVGATYTMKRVPLDAIPDLSDTQVIVYSRWDRSPDIIEDQVTYPIVTALLGAPKVKSVRGFSDFGFSYVYIIFEDGTDVYWARSRVLEYLSKITSALPDGSENRVGAGRHRGGVGVSIRARGQDRAKRFGATAEFSGLVFALLAPIGARCGGSGFHRGVSKTVSGEREPQRASYRVPLMKVVEAIRAGNNDVGGRLVEFSGTEYMVRGRGYAKSKDDLENIVLGRERPERDADFGQEHRSGGDRAGNAARHRGLGRRRETPWVASW
jgi:Cu(I)/Ag(I) efflux system membrane protein CusA/SilA